MKNVKITVSGINSEYIIIEPDKIDSIPGKLSQIIKVKINAPAYFTGRKYTLIFEISSTLVGNQSLQSTPLIERRVITLYILEVSKNESSIYLNNSQSFVSKMNESGMNINKVSNLLNELEKAYQDIDYSRVENLYSEIKTIYENAFEAKSIIEELEKNIAQKKKEGISVIETEKMLFIGKTIYARGDYTLALEKLREAKLVYATEVKGEFNLVYTVKNNPIQSLGILLGLSLFGFGSSILVRYQLYRKKLRMLYEEEVLLLELMKVVQRECFENNKMSMEEYEQAMIQYENQLSKTIEEKITTETKLANLLKVKGKKRALGEEKKRLTDLIKRAQDDYLNKGKIETRVYENMVKSYTSRLSEVEEQIANLDAQEAVKKQRKSGSFFKIINASEGRIEKNEKNTSRTEKLNEKRENKKIEKDKGREESREKIEKKDEKSKEQKIEEAKKSGWRFFDGIRNTIKNKFKNKSVREEQEIKRKIKEMLEKKR